MRISDWSSDVCSSDLNRASPSSAALRPFRSAPGAGPVRPPSFVAMKAAAVAVDPTREHPMSTDHDDTGFEPEHASSPTDHVLSELQLYGFRHFQDEPAPRPLPEGTILAGPIRSEDSRFGKRMVYMCT